MRERERERERSGGDGVCDILGHTLLFSSLLLILSAKVYTVYPHSPNIGKTVKHNIFINCIRLPVCDNGSSLQNPTTQRMHNMTVYSIMQIA